MRDQTSGRWKKTASATRIRILRLAVAFCCLLALSTLLSPAFAQARIALVIGNGAYQHAPELVNPKNDATDMAKTLKTLGFDVILGVDVNSGQLRDLVQAFGANLSGVDIALFFYAGHGLQIDGRNFFLPTDANIQEEADVDFEAIELDLIYRQMDRRAKAKIVLLDACRNNPFEPALTRSMGQVRSAGSLGRGLAPVQPAGGAFIGFATDPGAVAFDGEGRNSPFTKALLRHMTTPGLEINTLMTRVRADVFTETGDRQRPWTTSSLIGELFLVGPRQERTSEDIAAWKAADILGKKEGFETYLEVFPDGLFRDLAFLRLAAMTPSAKDKPKAPDRTNQVDRDAPNATVPNQTPAAVAMAGTSNSPTSESSSNAAYGAQFRDCLGCPEMVVLPAGRFEMGVDFGPAAEKPKIRKLVDSAFALGRSEVTRRQWKVCVLAGACRDLPGPADEVPAAGLSYLDAVAYATWLSRHTGRAYRLPSEAEWEYAARAREGLRYPSGPVLQPKDANYNRPGGAPLTVASYAANPFGLHDLAGNVWEWVADCGALYDTRSTGVEPVTAKPCVRVLRGGGFRSEANQLRSSNRFFMQGDKHRDDFGFRLALDLN